MRFWDTDRGRILISGRDVKEINTKNLRGMESFLTQDTMIFHDTIAENIAIADAGASSMIDISDGLLADLGHIADASGVGFRLRSEAFEVPDALGAVAATTGSDPLRFVLTGGEDHALVATFDPVDVPDDWLIIGRVVAEPRVLVDDAEWDTEEGSGYVHFRN